MPVTREPSLVETARLLPYLCERLPYAPREDAPFAIRKHEAGFSNLTYFLDWGERRLVLRRPPPGDLLPTSHDVAREFRVLAALQGTAARVPRPLLLCEDAGVIGAPFYLMERLEGEVVRTALPAVFDTPAQCRLLGEELIDALVDLHAVDWRAAGLAEIGRPSGYVERQLRRWQGQIDLTLPKTRPLPEFGAIGDWLRAHTPPETPATLVHGDYKLDNLIFAAETPTHALAVLDWEMATLGDPLADLGWGLCNWGMNCPPESPIYPVMSAPGIASPGEMAARYAEQTGRSVARLPFYIVLGLWKLAALMEGLYMLYLQGRAANPLTANMETGVPKLLARAQAATDVLL
jgi:aminoglycoside phosphotransferase (APT) family kinase protein